MDEDLCKILRVLNSFDGDEVDDFEEEDEENCVEDLGEDYALLKTCIDEMIGEQEALRTPAVTVGMAVSLQLGICKGMHKNEEILSHYQHT